MSQKDLLRQRAFDLAWGYYKEVHGSSRSFGPGRSFINYDGRYSDDRELVNLADPSLDFWLTAGPWARKFGIRFAEWLGVGCCSLTNLGSSANLLAFMALTSLQLDGRRIRRGDEVITVICSFPTTVTSCIQYGAVPVPVDVIAPEYSIDVTQLEAALSPRTRTVMIARPSGNPLDLQAVEDFCDKYNLWLVEDNCDASGFAYTIGGVEKKTGTINYIGTNSFYPPHHITMGEGGAIYIDDLLLHKLVNSLRDWGHNCWCIGGVDSTCKYRFSKQFGDLPVNYDHKYVYSHFGHSLKVIDMQTAIGCAQFEELDSVIEARRSSFVYLKEGLVGTSGPIFPEAQKDSDPSWFGFPISVKEDADFTHSNLSRYLENRKTQIRNLSTGDLLKHPAFDEMRSTDEDYRVIGNLEGTDHVMNHTLWIGVYPGMTRTILDRMIGMIRGLISSHK